MALSCPFFMRLGSYSLLYGGYMCLYRFFTRIPETRTDMRLALLIIPLLVPGNLLGAEDSVEQRLDPRGIPGKLVICGGGQLPASVIEHFVEAAGGESGRLVVIPTASAKAAEAKREQFTDRWQDQGLQSVTLLHARSREEANAPKFASVLRDATAVWFVGGQQSRLANTYIGTAVETALDEVLARGGVIGGTSAGAAIQSRVMIARGNPIPIVTSGLDLLPGCVIDQHFTARNRKPRLLRAIADHPSCVGCGVDERTALLVDGRRFTVLGEGSVTVCLPESKQSRPAEIVLREGDVADLTALRRIARTRAAGRFPPQQVGRPHVEKGSLLLGGGGRMPKEVLQKFIEMAGGSDAKIVILPTAVDPVPERVSEVKIFQRLGATDVVVLPQRTREEVESDEFRQVLEAARGVWFSGGRQWRFVDAYEDTSALGLFRGVLRRGGVIGGSSAGASIQAEYLARGNPLGNREIMSEGYERGLRFLPGVAVDQHFAQRQRFADMSRLVETFPQLLGIGIDESTALFVTGKTGMVIGKNAVHFYDGTTAQGGDQPPLTLRSGQQYDLVSRTTVGKDG